MKLMSFAAAAAFFMPGAEALACGGFMCDQAQPVMQNAERIVFGVDEVGGVDMHVQVSYEGPSENFAWILPVPGEPEIFLSIDTLFNQLAVRTAPLFTLNRIDEGDCRSGNGGLLRGDTMDIALSDSGVDEDGSGVNVVAQAQVGPYDTVTLQASSADELLDWLQENGFDLPDDLDSALSPYVAEDSYFVALKLAKDKDDGDIAPVGLHFQSDSTSIPIQLTSIAATPDMVLEVYVFGNERAVPESYLHVQINDAAIDWFNNAQNYSDVITMAADEAGGHAFATDFSGDASQFQDGVYYEGQCDIQHLFNETDALTFVNNLWWSGCPFSDQVFSVLEAYIPVPSSAGNITAGTFYSCMDCYVSSSMLASIQFDAGALVEDIDTFVVEPMKNAEALFEDFSTLSRMTSSVSPVEMTVDPTFVLNPDMGDVDNSHSADLVTECGNGRIRDKAPRRLDLVDGRSIRLPSESWFEANETTESEFLAELGTVNAMVIEATGASGDPEIIFDYTEEGQIAVDSFNKMVQRLTGCGCATGAEPVGALYLSALLGAAALRRREND